jgi:hypothetical protein
MPKMVKLYFTLFSIAFILIQLVSTDCLDRHLYCFNDNEEILGDILVHFILFSHNNNNRHFL